MKTTTLFALLTGALVALAAPTGALAQTDNWEFNLHAGAYQRDLGLDIEEFDLDDQFDNTDTDVLLGTRLFRHWENGLGVGANFDWVLADEIDFPEGSENEDANLNTFFYSAELVYTFPTAGPVDFFANVGVGGATLQCDDCPFSEDFEDDFLDTDLLVPVGIGLKFLNDAEDPTWGLRVDARDNILFEESLDPDELDEDVSAENTWEISGGISFFFGGGPRTPPPPPDSDRDGVTDDRDRCPGTPVGVQVGPDGCPIPVDSDNDGVPNDRDRCPNTPAGVRVDADGCEIEPEPEPERAACVDGRDWYRTDASIFVEDRSWVKFGPSRTVAEADVEEIGEYDGVPVYVRSDAGEPYREILLPLCTPANTYQVYRPEQAIRGTTG